MSIELIEVGVEVIAEEVDAADVDPCEEGAEPVRALLVDNLSKRRAAEHEENSPSYGNLRGGESSSKPNGRRARLLEQLSVHGEGGTMQKNARRLSGKEVKEDPCKT